MTKNESYKELCCQYNWKRESMRDKIVYVTSLCKSLIESGGRRTLQVDISLSPSYILIVQLFSPLLIRIASNLPLFLPPCPPPSQFFFFLITEPHQNPATFHKTRGPFFFLYFHRPFRFVIFFFSFFYLFPFCFLLLFFLPFILRFLIFFQLFIHCHISRNEKTQSF